jgi:hypothetical protein
VISVFGFVNRTETLKDFGIKYDLISFVQTNVQTATQNNSRDNVTADNSSANAVNFVLSRRAAFENVGMRRNWRLRGLGYLYTQHKVILTATLPERPTVGQNTVVIHNVHPESEMRNDCNLFTIWVRVRGPEIVAGSAQAVEATNEKSCYWKFNFELQVEGRYGVDAKGLIWNGEVEHTDKMKCNFKKGKLPTKILDEYPLHAGFQGFKLYAPEVSCCEICARLHPYCMYWATPPMKLENPSRFINGCEFFFGNDVPEEFIPRSYILGDINTTLSHFKGRRLSTTHRNLNEVEYTHGRPHGEPVSYFFGCGWSNWFTLDFPCLSAAMDDQVHMTENEFDFVQPAKAKMVSKEMSAPSLPLCTLENEKFDQSNGRWVREMWPTSNETSCPPPRYKMSAFNIIEYDGAHPHCWHRDDFTTIGHKCMEMNCKFIRPDAKWISPLRINETKWMGVWRQRTCDYYEYTDTELQQCFNTRKISGIKVEGASIASFLDQYLQQRLSTLTLFNNSSDPEAISVILSSLSLVHQASLEDKLMAERLRAMNDVGPRQEIFWVSSFYVASERDTYVVVDRMNQINHRVYDTLTPKGYKMLNLYDISAAFSYDTATQFDGLHIIGPPMKMALTKLFHFMCKATVVGSRL